MRTILFTVALAVAAMAPAGPALASSFDAVMTHYEPVRKALIADSMEGVADHGEKILAELRALEADFNASRAGIRTDAAETVEEKLPAMIEAARSLAGATGLAQARDALYALSKPMVRWREALTADDRPEVAYCSMHKRSWLQEGTEIGNPYGGMPRCGSIVS